MKSFFTKKDVTYNLRTPNLLTLPKINTKKFDLCFYSFRTSDLWNQLPDHIKYETSVKGFKNNLKGNWRAGNNPYNKSCVLCIYYLKIIVLC